MEVYYNYEKERQEAVSAGNRALASLRQAKAQLDSARNWGIWDMMGGGLMSSLIKRSRINNAQGCIEQAKRDLKMFERELGDINMNGQMNIEINDFIGYMDILWDNFLVDWMMQDRINSARDQLDQVIWRVENILRNI